MRKRVYIILTALLCLSLLAGCAPNDSTGASASPTADVQTETPAATLPNTPEPSGTVQPSNGGQLTLEEAKAAALQDAGLTAEQVTFRKEKQDFDDGRQVYEVEFTSESTEYEYEIAATGEILSKELKAVIGQGEDGIPQTQDFVGAAAAQDAALKHAGVSASRAWGVEVDLEHEDGIWVYEVSFHAGGFEYDYEIDALSGQVRAFESEVDD
ncbi:MAG: hypothetical protein HFF09_00295 [Oscillospiraceae bacterium]|nr:hypothetical protein [Oscillospiraceae bacterium]